MKHIAQEFVTVAQDLNTGSHRPESDVLPILLLVKFIICNVSVICMVLISPLCKCVSLYVCVACTRNRYILTNTDLMRIVSYVELNL